MYYLFKKQRRSLWPLSWLIFLFFYYPVYSQNIPANDTVIKISPGTLIQIGDSTTFFSKDTVLVLPASMKKATASKENRNMIFFDSLKAKASKNTITKKLYDLVIVSPDTIDKKRITGSSEENYIIHSGKKIRKIDIQRLNVFGVDISNPAKSDTGKIENLLNKAHINTNEKIIRNNLLFSAGDTVSPLIVSENERILRQLPYINDARIIIIPVSDDEVDILVITKDVYSLGADFSFHGLKKGSVSLFEKNILGTGHEFGIEMPFDSEKPGSPGFGIHYTVDNIGSSFTNLNLYFLNGLGEKTYGFDVSRKFFSATTKYAGGISIRHMYTTEDLDTINIPLPLKFNIQDYWLSRSFLVNKESVSRIIIGGRYKNNNVFERPVILPESYYYLQKYRIYLASAAFSVQKYYKTNLIYGYGRTEDIPYGGLLKITAGREINEFKERTYLGAEISFGKSSKGIGYFYSSAGLASFFNERNTEQGILLLRMKYFSNLLNLGSAMIRNFVDIEYTRGFDRYFDEYLAYKRENGFAGFRNDSVQGAQRLSVSLESVLFSPVNFYDFRFALFGFADFSFLSGTNELISNGSSLSGIGMGIRIRNNNLVFKTFQVRLGFFPNPPMYSKINHISVSGEQLLRPDNFDCGPPSIIPYR